MDNRTANAIVLMGFIELIITSYFYGLDKFTQHIKEMGMYVPSFLMFYWKICWKIITPAIIGYVTINKWIDHQDDSYLNYVYPGFAQFLGWGIELFPFSVVVFFTIYTLITRYRAGKELAFLKTGPLLSPKESWGRRADAYPAVMETETIEAIETKGQDNDAFEKSEEHTIEKAV